MNIVIFDLEATCWQGSPPGMEQEIIEIGAWLINPFGEILGEYNRFVRPWLHPHLSAFCQELTSIKQENVDRAKGFEEVIEEFKEWAGIYDNHYLLCSWGRFDKKMLQHDCQLHGLEEDWVESHINIKAQYRDLQRLPKAIGLKKAVQREGFEFEGTHHRAIDDAHNLMKIFVKYLDIWQY